MKISVNVLGLQSTRAYLAGQMKQVNFAAARAINAAAYEAYQATTQEIARVFDRPTPWVRNSVRYTKATRDNLVAQVDFDRWGNKAGVTVAQVLAAEIAGGNRRLKRHERALQRVGILPAGMAIVPGPGAQRDQYGNMPGSQIVQIISYFQAFGETGFRANMRDGGRRLARGHKKTGRIGFVYFALKKKHGRLVPGIYQRFNFTLGSAIRPVLFFVRIPKYRQALDFYGIAERVARAEFDAKFPLYLDEAMRTARE